MTWDWLFDPRTSVILLVLASVCNMFSAYRNARASRALRGHMRRYNRDLGRLIGFVVFVCQPESGAPERIRELARQTIPEGIRIEPDVMAAAPDQS